MSNTAHPSTTCLSACWPACCTHHEPHTTSSTPDHCHAVSPPLTHNAPQHHAIPTTFHLNTNTNTRTQTRAQAHEPHQHTHHEHHTSAYQLITSTSTHNAKLCEHHTSPSHTTHTPQNSRSTSCELAAKSQAKSQSACRTAQTTGRTTKHPQNQWMFWNASWFCP